MSASTTIFRLCDEDDDLELVSEPSSRSGLYEEPPHRFGVDEDPDRPQGRDSNRAVAGEREPWDTSPATEPHAEAAAGTGSWPIDEHGDRGLFEWDAADDSPDVGSGRLRDRWFEREPLRAAAGGLPSWLSPRVVAVGAIVIVALLVVAIGHSARPAGRSPARQRPVVAAAVGADAQAPLPAPATSPRSGRRPSPQPPSAPPSKWRPVTRRHRPMRSMRPARRSGRTTTASARRPRLAISLSAQPRPQPTAPATAPATAPIQVASPPPAETPAGRPQPPNDLPPAEFGFER